MKRDKFKTVMTENLSKLMSEIKAQIQKFQRIPRRINLRKEKGRGKERKKKKGRSK